MHLLELSENIPSYFANSSTSAADVGGVDIHAMVYHPLFPYLLYILYGITEQANTTAPYAHYSIMLWNTVSQAFTQNFTVPDAVNFQCTYRCIMEVTQYIMLVESHAIAYIIDMDSDGMINGTVLFKGEKNGWEGNDNILRWADIHEYRYAFSDAETLVVGNAANASAVVQQNYTLTETANKGIPNYLLQVLMDELDIFIVYDPSGVTVGIISCWSCLLPSSGSNLSITSLICGTDISCMTTSATVTNHYQEAIGNSDGDFRAVWVSHDSIISKEYLYNRTQLISHSYISSFMASNGEFIMFYNHSEYFILRSFGEGINYNLSVHDYQASIGVIAMAPAPSKRVAIVPDGHLDVTQYIRVDDCTSYDATISGSFCVCNSYTATHCNSAVVVDNSTNSTNGTSNSTNSTQNSTSNSTSSNSTSTSNQTTTNSTTPTTSSTLSTSQFPIFASVGAGVGAIVTAVVVVLVVKKCKRWLKVRKRTRWQYDPTDIISFEV